jgi:DNA-binding MarR family transcriptional regulator
MDKFRNLVIFLEAAQSDSFAAAGRKLNLSPSAVSKAISRLEANFNITLFHRSSRHLCLTPEGQIYYDRYSQLFNQIPQIEADLRSQPIATESNSHRVLSNQMSGMITGIKQRSIVGKNGKIEIPASDLPEGANIEIIVWVEVLAAIEAYRSKIGV